MSKKLITFLQSIMETATKKMMSIDTYSKTTTLTHKYMKPLITKK